MSLTENTGREQERISFTLFTKDKGILTKRMKLTEGPSLSRMPLNAG